VIRFLYRPTGKLFWSAYPRIKKGDGAKFEIDYPGEWRDTIRNRLSEALGKPIAEENGYPMISFLDLIPASTRQRVFETLDLVLKEMQETKGA
jgi:hypothetical protein